MSKRKKHRQILIVDGYNIIGSWPQLKELKEQDRMDEARDLLISLLADYQSFSGTKVLVVFDAYTVPGLGRKQQQFQIEIFYTKERETADERIEKLVAEYWEKNTQIYVATSDYTSQRVIFGQGALRKSARELLLDVQNIGKEIEKSVEKTNAEISHSRIQLPDEIAKIFEKWRRE